jgi:hypothetical protein
MSKNKLKSYSCAMFLMNIIALNFSVPSVHATSVEASNSSFSDSSNNSTTTPTTPTTTPTATSSNPATNEQINLHLFALEKQLFSEEYTSETFNQRLNRLDRFVLGSVQPGSVTKRLNRLVMDIPTAQSSAPKLAPETAQSASEQPISSGESRSSNPTSNFAPGQNSNYSDSSPSSSYFSSDTGAESNSGSREDYPTVDALERQILGRTEETLPLSTRLANLEQKAFGKPSASSDDLALRVDRLKSYERSKNGGEEYLAQSPPTFAANQPLQTLSVTAKLDMIEKVVFAKTYPKDGVVSRLNRLEKAVYPSKPVETFASVPARVNRLMASLQINETSDADRFAQNGFSSAPVFTDPNSGRATNVKAHHSFLHKLGKIASVVGEGALMSMGGGGMMMGGYPGMYGGYPGYGGMYGGGMSPFGYNR